MGVGGQHHAQASLPAGEGPGTHVTVGWVATRAIWVGAENLMPNGIWSLDLPACSGHCTNYTIQAHYMLVKYNINNTRFLSLKIFSIGLKFTNSAQNFVLIV